MIWGCLVLLCVVIAQAIAYSHDVVWWILAKSDIYLLGGFQVFIDCVIIVTTCGSILRTPFWSTDAVH